MHNQTDLFSNISNSSITISLAAENKYFEHQAKNPIHIVLIKIENDFYLLGKEALFLSKVANLELMTNSLVSYKYVTKFCNKKLDDIIEIFHLKKLVVATINF